MTEFFTPRMGGSTQVVYQVSRHLAQRGHQVTVCTSDFGRHDPPYPDTPFRILRFRSLPTRWKFYVTPGLAAWIRKHLEEFDIIHMHNVRTFQNAVIGQVARRMGIPYVISAHGSLPLLIGHHAVKRLFDRLFGPALIAGAGRFIAVSAVEMEQYLAARIPGEKLALIPNGLDLKEFDRLPRRGVFRDRLGIGQQTRLVLYLGRLHKRKGVNFLIEAFARLSSHMNDSMLVVAGPDDGELANLQDLAGRLGTGWQVIFTGPLYGEDKLAAYVDADVTAYPSQHEIFGLVPFESILCGTPVVVTDDCGSGRIVRESEAGYVIPYGDVDALAATLERTLLYPGESSDMVLRGQKYIHEKMDWNTIIALLEELYKSETNKSGDQTPFESMLVSTSNY